jgi:hypothetical protein
MSALPPLNLRFLPSEPAGLPSTYTSRSIRLRHIIEIQKGGAFSTREREIPKRTVQLSHRDLLSIAADKRKYAAWLARWDRDSGVGRFLLLSEFLKQCFGMSKAQMDETYGHCSELVFIHILAFVRLNYARACSIALQLQVLRVFFDASSGYCFAIHFLKAGGTTVLTDLLKMQDNLVPEDLTEILNTFLSLSVHGPHAQELMADTKVVNCFTQELPRFTDHELHRLTVMLFAQLAEGDEAHAEFFCDAFRSKFGVYSVAKSEALTTAAHIFRVLLTPNLAAECDVRNAIGDFLVLTTSDSLEVQHAGIAIFEQLLNNALPARRKFLLDVVIDLITVNADEVPPDLLEQRFLQQSFAVRLLHAILKTRSPTAEALYEQIQRVLPAVVRTLGNTLNFAAQKAACAVLARLVDKWPQTRTCLTNAMPAEWATALLTSPHQFCLQLTPTQIDTFQGAEASHFFFDVVHDPVAQKRRRTEASAETKLTLQGSNLIPNPLKMRRNPLKYVPVGNPDMEWEQRGTSVEAEEPRDLIPEEPV